MAKGTYFLLSLSVLALAFLYNPETQNTNVKRSPVKQQTPLEKRDDGILTMYKTVGRETATMWKTFTPISAQATKTIVQPVQTITQTKTVGNQLETGFAIEQRAINEADYQSLYDTIEFRIQTHESVDLRPKYVRAAFHDLYVCEYS